MQYNRPVYVNVNVDQDIAVSGTIRSIFVDNATDCYLYIAEAGRTVEPQCSRCVLPISPTSVAIHVRWQAPPGTAGGQPTPSSTLQQAVLILSDKELPPSAGMVMTAAVQAASTWDDGTVAAPGWPNTTQANMGLYRPANNVFGFVVNAAEVMRLTTTGMQLTGAFTPEADNTRDLGTSALRFRDAYLGTSLRFGTNPASAGTIRLPNTGDIQSRNAANSANFPLLSMDGSNVLQVGDSTTPNAAYNVAVAGIHAFQFVGTNVFELGNTYLTLGKQLNSAVSGILRIPNNYTINVRNAANSADIGLLHLNGSNKVVLGGQTPTTDGDLLTVDAATTGGIKWSAPTGLSLTLTAEQATTSGTSIDFTGIPSGVKRITVMFAGVSTNGTSRVMIQLGDSGGIETTNYIGVRSGGGAADSNISTGFEINGTSTNTASRDGTVILTLEDSSDNTWTCMGNVADTSAINDNRIVGRKATSAVLDRVRITTVNGTDTFDAGAVSISYEK